MFEHEKFSWDKDKDKINFHKHGVWFDEAKEVFADERVVIIPDDVHSQYEERFVAIGEITTPRLLMVCHCYRENNIIRIISARKPTKQEINIYYGGLV